MQVWILTFLFTAAGAIISQPPSCSHPAICAPKVIASCPGRNNYNVSLDECPTCCCESSENVEFYNSNRPEPRCTAPPAVFTVKFVFTWSQVCHPDYYFSSAHWSPPTGASHNPQYQMWDACMNNVSAGVAQVSQIGATRLIEQEYEAAGDNILDTFKASVIFPGVGTTFRDLDVDKDHQWVSAISMLAPSRDRMVGVADLRLCDGHDWKRSVKVCSELFSTATRSSRVHDPMERNSVQWNNCSFGYIEFTFKEYQDSNQTAPDDCEFNSKYMCPPIEQQPKLCRTCCCAASDNVDFLQPDFVCDEEEEAFYKVVFKHNFNPICHSDFFFNTSSETPFFSGLVITSHGYGRTYDRCVMDPNAGHSLNSTRMKILLENGKKIGFFFDYFLSDNYVKRSNKSLRSGYIRANSTNPYLSIGSNLITYPYRQLFVGVSGLNLCDKYGWKSSIAVCTELFRFEDETDEIHLMQGNQCSFGTFILTRTRAIENYHPIPPSPSGGSSGLSLDYCCHFEFIIEGRVKRHQRLFYDHNHKLLVHVTNVDYDDINHIKVDDIVEIEVSRLPVPIRFKRTYKLAGRRECGSNRLTIDETGLLTRLLDFEGDNCAQYIEAGNCNDPR